MKPLTEIKKGCGKQISYNSPYLPNEICGLGDLCPTCQALLEQAQEFEKMIEKLKRQIELELKIIEEYIKSHDKTSLAEQSKLVYNNVLFGLNKLLKEVQDKQKSGGEE
jgi:hypothetical protein